MRTLLTFIAVALTTALLVALVAPPLIDWSARREMVARAVAERIGSPVTIGGKIEAQALPLFTLDLIDVAIGPPGAPWLKVPRVHVETSLFSLFGGRMRIEELTLERPTITLGPRFVWPDTGAFALDRVKLDGGEARIVRDSAAPITLSDLSLEASSQSGRGPLRLRGSFAGADNGRAQFDVALDAVQADEAPVRGGFDAGALHVNFDGRLKLGDSPAFTGHTALAGVVAAPEQPTLPWRVEGDLNLTAEAARFADARFDLGENARTIEAKGSAELRLDARASLAAHLKAETLNFDSLLRREKETFVPAPRALSTLAALANNALRQAGPFDNFAVDMAADRVFVGARRLEAPKLKLSGKPDEPMRLALETGLPGDSSLKLSGDLNFGAAPDFAGQAQWRIGDFAALAAWTASDSPELAGQLSGLQRALPNSVVSGAGEVEVSSEGFSVRKLDLDVAASHFGGGVVYTRADDDGRARLFLDLTTDALDIDVSPNIEAGLDYLGDTDLDFRLAARTLRVARVGLASVQGGSLDIRARKDGAKFTLNKLSIADLGGASVQMEGETSPAGRWTRVKLDAARLHDFASLLARAAPGPITRWLQARADDLGAAKATLEARRDGPPLPGPFGLDFLKADGEIAATRFTAAISRAPAPVDAVSADLRFDAGDAGGLLRKLGFALPAGATGRGELSISGSGQWASGFDAKARLALAGSELNWRGALHPAETDAPILAGPLTVKSPDLLPALAALGIATAGQGVAAPADLSGDLEARIGGANLSKLAGSIAGSHVKGSLTFKAPETDARALDNLIAAAKEDAADFSAAKSPPPALTGDLEFDRISASALAALALGRAGATRQGALWSEAKFAPALLAPPMSEIAIHAGAFDFGYAVGKSFAARLRVAADELALEDLDMGVNGGRVAGRASLRRAKGAATLAGALHLDGVPLERTALRAHLGGGVEFASNGESPAALMAGLAGAGNATLSDVRIAKLDPDGVARALVKIEAVAGASPDANKLQALLGAEIDKGALTMPKYAGTLALSSGVLRASPQSLPARDGSANVSGALNLADLDLSVLLSVTDEKTGPFWSGPPPVVEIEANGPLDTPVRRIDVALLASGLAAESIARETDRIESFEADVRERAAFNRKLKAERFLARRDDEIEAFEEARERDSLMKVYLPAYEAWAASHEDTTHGR